MSNPINAFKAEVIGNLCALGQDQELRRRATEWVRDSSRHRYSYNFSWMGQPIIQYPQDMVAMQEIIWKVRPDVIVENGIAHGGSLIYYASLLALLGGDGRVVGVDVEIRPHNRDAIKVHPMAERIEMIQGSSIDPAVVSKVKSRITPGQRVMVVLDSNHTHDHVLEELRIYSPLVGENSYLVVFDTVIEDMPSDFFPDRPWGVGNNPKTAVHAFLKENDRFAVDEDYNAKLQISVAPDGYLKCLRNST